MKITIGSNEGGQRIDKFLRKLLNDMPLSAIYKALRKKDIKLNGGKVKEDYFIQEGDVIEISQYVKFQPKTVKFIKVESGGMKITYEDENMILVEKWPGVLVHSDSPNGDPTLTDYVLSYLNEKGEFTPENELTFTPAPCNRLDRNTSGIVIFGKNFESLKLLNEMIRDRSIDKFYMALVKGRVKDGLHEAYIMKDEENNFSKIYDEDGKNRKKISMRVKNVESVGIYSFIEIELITGRSHQLRAHLAHLGNPILGDSKYGEKKLNSYYQNKYGLSYQFLYAFKVIFKECPDKLSYLKNKTIAETLPPIFKKIKTDIMKF
ncbi:MAG: pseudouridine synthase [Clostridiaceae bacterium]